MARAGVRARVAAGGGSRARAGGGVSLGSSRGREVVVSPRVRVSEMQRARLLSADVAIVDELGYARATVAHIAGRARVSRRTFYDLFDNREDCLLAVIEDTVELIAAEFAAAGVAGLASWRERIRAGLSTILCFFEREPVLARVCLVRSVQAGPRVLERREAVFALLAEALDEGREVHARGGELSVLTAEGLVGAAVAILCKRLLARDPEPLSGLLDPLMSMIVLPYLGPAAARRERKRPVPEAPADTAARSVAPSGDAWSQDPLREIPMRLTYRTARVLEVTAENPGASNRAIGEGAGIYDQGQVSKLLSRLQKLGLVINTGEGQPKGSANAWLLTPKGERVTHSLGSRVTPSTQGTAG
jgi:AcrR family transcriptional regulator